MSPSFASSGLPAEHSAHQASRSQTLLGDIHLVGAGVVGREVASAHLQSYLRIHLYEATEERLEGAIAWLANRFDDLKQTPIMDCLPFAHVGCVLERNDRVANEGSRGVPVFIESISERRDLKKQLLLAAQKALGPQAILGTNTSTLPLRDLIDGSLLASQLVGLHFFMPVPQRPLVEVIQGETTSEATIELAREHVHRLRRVPLVVADSPGFIVNRMLAPYLNQSLKALCSGAPAEMIEHAALVAGMPMSPLELFDWIGMETSFHAGRAFWQAFPKRLEPAPLLPAMVKAKLLGRQHGRGFYAYHEGKRSATLAPEALDRIAFYAQTSRPWNLQTLTEWLFFPLFLEAICLLQERVARNVAMIDLALMGGLGWTRSEGLRGICEPLTPPQLLQHIHSWGAESREFLPPADFVSWCSRSTRWDEVFEGMCGRDGITPSHT